MGAPKKGLGMGDFLDNLDNGVFFRLESGGILELFEAVLCCCSLTRVFNKVHKASSMVFAVGEFGTICDDDDDVFLLNGVFFEELLRRLAPLIFSFTGVLKVMDDNDSESDMVRNFWKFCAASSAFSCIGDNA